MDTINLLIKYKEAIFNGLLSTVHLFMIIWILGSGFGFIIGILSSRMKKTFGIFSRFVSFFLSGIPILVFLYWAHYPMQSYMSIIIQPFYTAALTFSFINIFLIAEIFREAISSLPQQYKEAALVCGLDVKTKIFKIEIPLIFRRIVSPYLISQINILHATLFASLITVDEIFLTAQRIISHEQNSPVEIYTILGGLFLLISLPINGLAIFLKRKYSKEV